MRRYAVHYTYRNWYGDSFASAAIALDAFDAADAITQATLELRDRRALTITRVEPIPALKTATAEEVLKHYVRPFPEGGAFS